MSAVMELVDDSREFFSPCSSDLIDGLLGQYRDMRGRIDTISGMLTAEMSAAVGYFLEGNRNHDRYAPAVSTLFNPVGAIAALNSAYWSKTINLTDVFDCMPQKRRDEWSKSIHDMTTPEFTEEAVRPTIAELLASRTKFFSERVDGIFRALSGDHVTNSPMGFGKRMIVGYVLNEYSSVGYTQSGHINDLRAVIAKFMGRDEPKHYASSRLIETLKHRWGEWVTIDGGAMRIRLYKKGTAHMEIHPDMAWRLNSILANLYPMAIPAEHRMKPKKRAKEFQMMGRPLPFAVLELLAEYRPKRSEQHMSIGWRNEVKNSAALDEAKRVLRGIGGVESQPGTFYFDYAPGTVIDEIVTSGCIPDQKSHQYYPTPENVALAAVELAEIGPRDYCLEPSAGQGGLADYMPKDKTTCIEISELHCKILLEKGYTVVQGDFIAWSGSVNRTCFDRIIMNPPFSEGRWQAHIEHAATLLNPGCRMVAILPASAKGKNVLPGLNLTWSREYSNEFNGTSVSVVIMCGVKP